MEVNSIQPTFTCFDDAVTLLGELLREGKDGRLVHAICRGDDGTRYAHAWVEYDGFAIETGLANGWQRVSYSVAQLEFYAARRVERTWAYTFIEMIAENRTHQHVGPWIPELRALCGGRRIVARVQAQPPRT